VTARVGVFELNSERNRSKDNPPPDARWFFCFRVEAFDDVFVQSLVQIKEVGKPETKLITDH